MQVDFTDPNLLRCDVKSQQHWEEIKLLSQERGSKTRAKDVCREKGVNVGSLLSPCNLLWQLYGFCTTRQLCVDHFHVIAEGLASLLVAAFFTCLTPAAAEVVQASFKDPDTWDPCASK